MAGLLLPYKGTMPRVAADAFIADGTQVIGDVDIAARANIWFNCVIRATSTRSPSAPTPTSRTAR